MGNARAVTALLKLAGFTNGVCYVDVAHRGLAQMLAPTGGRMMSQYPLGACQWLQGLACALLQPRENAILGDLESADTQASLRSVPDGCRPCRAW